MKVKKIKEAMFYKNISSVKLAEKINMPRQLLSYLINEQALPLKSDVKKIAEVLGVKANKLWNKRDYFVQALNNDFETSLEKSRKDTKLIGFRVAASCGNRVMTKSNLNKLGYKSLQDWGTAQMQRFEEELLKLEEKENVRI